MRSTPVSVPHAIRSFAGFIAQLRGAAYSSPTRRGTEAYGTLGGNGLSTTSVGSAGSSGRLSMPQSLVLNYRKVDRAGNDVY